ncbi:MAG: hypothetical protein ACTH0V_08895 [Microbacteriaceae bacterium]
MKTLKTSARKPRNT